MSEFEERAEVVIGLFRDLFGCDGQRFGSPSLGVLGISDGLDGVQWNAGYSRSEQTASLGVNLEGKKYDDWPVARLIEREMSHPILLTQYRARVARPEMVTVSWKRDAWQISSRVRIKESRLFPHSDCAGSARRRRLDSCTATREGLLGSEAGVSWASPNQGHPAPFRSNG